MPSMILLSIISLLLTTATTTAVTLQSPTYGEFLEDYILPWIHDSLDVKSYTLNKDTGEFKVNLRRNSVQISLSDRVTYFKCKSTIKGVMNKDKSNVTNLEGVSAKAMDFLVDVKDIAWVIGDSGGTDRFPSHVKWNAYPISIHKLMRDRRGFWSKVLGFVKEKIMRMKGNYKQSEILKGEL